ncbi:MAG: cyclic nucleotide-binding domain-containing protein [Planctomycetes bacterium]|nr:cyclic nucleotide-binding domain-containing protein [Planctomycetota bacterium]
MIAELCSSDVSFSMEYFTYAVLLGGLSAVSLPLGSALGLLVTPKHGVTGFLAAFGGGALLTALTLELVSPACTAYINEDHTHGHATTNLIVLVIGAVVGGILFVILDTAVNSKGGFLRKSSTTIAYLSRVKKEQFKEAIEHMSKIKLMHGVPASLIAPLMDFLRVEKFKAGDLLFEEGEEIDRIYFIDEGKVTIKHNGEVIETLGEGDSLGEAAVLATGITTYVAKADTEVVTFALLREDVKRLRAASHEFDEAVRAHAESQMQEVIRVDETAESRAVEWKKEAVKAMKLGAEIPHRHEVNEEKKKHSGAPLAIWLGILLDGIPESFTIGAGFLFLLAAKLGSGIEAPTFLDLIPYTLIAGLFLSNFPEAMSSSIEMKAQGWEKWKILFMWTTLMIVTAIGAGVGYALGGYASHEAIVGIEGMAAGAMLTMIASSMIPEAVHLGGARIAGLSTLAGFVAAILFKFLE